MCIVVGMLLPSRETFDMIGYPWLYKAIRTEFGGDQVLQILTKLLQRISTGADVE